VGAGPAESPAVEAPDLPVGADQAGQLTLERVQGIWASVVGRMSARDRQVQALLRDARPLSVQGDVITVECKWPLHRDQLSRDERRALVEQVMGQALGRPCRVQFSVQVQAQQPAMPVGDADGSSAAALATSSDVSTSGGPQDEIRRALLNHPVVRDLERKGGKVSRVDIFGAEPPKEKDGE
jgi:hypothetical protein